MKGAAAWTRSESSSRSVGVLLGLFFSSHAWAAQDVFSGMAAGLRSGLMQRAEFGAGVAEKIFVEPIFHAYFSTPIEQLYLRPNVHVSYLWDQSEMPKAVRVEESDLYSGLGLAFLWDWVVIPSLEVGAQILYRRIQLVTSEPVAVEDDRITNQEWLYPIYVQSGVGLSFFQGLFVAEPFIRWRYISGDDRERYAFGVDLSFEVGR